MTDTWKECGKTWAWYEYIKGCNAVKEEGLWLSAYLNLNMKGLSRVPTTTTISGI